MSYKWKFKDVLTLSPTSNNYITVKSNGKTYSYMNISSTGLYYHQTRVYSSSSGWANDEYKIIELNNFPVGDLLQFLQRNAIRLPSSNVNKVDLNGVTVLDLTSDTVSPSTLAKGVVAHDATGAKIVGTMVGCHIYAETNPALSAFNDPLSWEIKASTHKLDPSDLAVLVYDNNGAQVLCDVVVDNDGNVVIQIDRTVGVANAELEGEYNLSAGELKTIIIGNATSLETGGMTLAELAAQVKESLDYSAVDIPMSHTDTTTVSEKFSAVDTSIAQANSSITSINSSLSDVNESLATKQGTLSAGTGIVISGNTISTKVYPTNRNLLDNWYFGNPINQRGQTTYTGISTPTIDKWYTNGTVTLSDAGLVANTGGNVYFLYYPLEDALKKQLLGQTVTVSMLTSTGLISGSDVIPSTVSETWDTGGGSSGDLWIDIYGTDQSNGYKELRIFSTSITEDITIIAVKLEFGLEQTLAHRDSSGNWVLNEVPDYNEELLKCVMTPYNNVLDYSSNFDISPSFYGHLIRLFGPADVVTLSAEVFNILPVGWYFSIISNTDWTIVWSGPQYLWDSYRSTLAHTPEAGAIAVAPLKLFTITKISEDSIMFSGSEKPYTVNGVGTDVDHNITLTPANLGLTSNQIRTITSGTSDPSGGSNGNIYLQYS